MIYDLSYLMERSIPEPNTGCWLWLGSLNDKGYAKTGAKSPRTGHEVAANLRRGPVPPGMERDHICNVRCCVNPDHVRYLTHADNLRRIIHLPKEVCPHGHLMVGENVRHTATAKGTTLRKCRTCDREYRKRKKGKQND